MLQVRLLSSEGVKLKKEVELLSSNLEAAQKQVAALTQHLNEAEGRDERHAAELHETWEKLEAANQKLRKWVGCSGLGLEGWGLG